MNIEITKQYQETINEALQTWEKAPGTNAMLQAIMIAVISRGEVNNEMKDKIMSLAEIEMKRREIVSMRIRSLLNEYATRPSEFSVSTNQNPTPLG